MYQILARGSRDSESHWKDLEWDKEHCVQACYFSAQMLHATQAHSLDEHDGKLDHDQVLSTSEKARVIVHMVNHLKTIRNKASEHCQERCERLSSRLETRCIERCAAGTDTFFRLLNDLF